MKRISGISGISDLRRLETLGGVSSGQKSDDDFGIDSDEIQDDQLARRAQMIGTMSSYSVYQLSEATQHN